MTSSSSFVHLHVHSEHSALDSTARVGELIDAAAADEQAAIAITDHGTIAGLHTAITAGRAAGVKVIAGEEVYLAIGSRHERRTLEIPAASVATDASTGSGTDQTETKTKRYHHLTVLARNRTGWRNLVAMHNEAQNSRWGKHSRVDYELLAAHAEGLIVLTGCLGGPVLGPLARGDEAGAREGLEALIAAVGAQNVYVEIMEHGIGAESAALPRLVELASEYDLGVVATNDAHHVAADDEHAHEAWLALQTKKTLNDPASTRFTFTGTGYHLRSAEEMYALRPETWWRNACRASADLAAEIEADVLPDHYLRLPKFNVPEGFTDSREYFVHLVKEGAKTRYGDPYPAKVAKRLNMEMKVIAAFGVIDYFLIVHELITWARSQGIRVGPGRGSSAGSVCSYTLGIVQVDPLRFDLLFERFLDPTRVGMPDIDVDFEKARRDEVLAHLVHVYGQGYVARIGTFQVSKSKAAIKHATRVLGHPAGLGDRLSKQVPMKGASPSSFAAMDAARDSAAAGFWEEVEADQRAGTVIELARSFEEVVTGASIHSCGTVVSDAPLHDLIPMRKDTGDSGHADDPLVTEWDTGGVDEGIGLLKLDVLGLRTLDIISATVTGIEALTGEVVDPEHLPDGDDLSDERVRRTWQLLAAGRTEGVFQMKSSGMSALAQDVQPTTMEHLSALGALYRPGPLSADMHTRYAARKNERESVDYSIFTDDPDEQEAIARVLGSTYGLTVYQEQSMLLGDVVAGFGPAERNRLRKAISKKNASEVRAVGELFMAGATGDTTSDGRPKIKFARRTAQRVWDTIRGGAEYAFNRCLTGDAVLTNGSRQEITIGALYRRLHGQEPDAAGMCHYCQSCRVGEQSQTRKCRACMSWMTKFRDPNRGFHLLSRDASDGRIRPQRVSDVHFQGVRKIFRLTLSDGRTVKATENHRFMMPSGEYTRVDAIVPGITSLAIDAGYEPQDWDGSDRLCAGERQGVGWVYAPGRANIGYIDGGFISLKEWTSRTRANAKCDECGISEHATRLERAHLDGNRTNNHPRNLSWKCVSHHKKWDYRRNSRRGRWQKGALVGALRVDSVDPAGVEPVYDVEMESGTDHNFLANGIVSHNSHSAAYAQLSYVSAYLKANWPACYGAAILACIDEEDQRDGVLASLASEGVQVLAPQVNSSGVASTAMTDKTVVLGLSEIKDVGKASRAIVSERSAGGAFASIGDLLARVRLPGKDGQSARLTTKVAEALIDAGAADEFGPRQGQMRILRALREHPGTPVPDEEWGSLARGVRQIARLGLSVGEHPMTALAPQVRAWEPPLRDEYGNAVSTKPVGVHRAAVTNRRAVTTVGLVTRWKESSDGRGGQKAALTLEGSKGRIEAVVWDRTLRSLRRKHTSIGVGSVVGVQANVRTREIEQIGADGETRTVTIRSLTARHVWPLDVRETGARQMHSAGAGIDWPGVLFDPDPPGPTEMGPPSPGRAAATAAPTARVAPPLRLAGTSPPAAVADELQTIAGQVVLVVEESNVPSISSALKTRYRALAKPPRGFYEPVDDQPCLLFRVAGKDEGDWLWVVSVPDEDAWRESDLAAHLRGAGTWKETISPAWQRFQSETKQVPVAA